MEGVERRVVHTSSSAQGGVGVGGEDEAVVVGSWLGVPSASSLVLFGIGWACGWFLLWRTRPLPVRPPQRDRVAVAVVVPARDEEATLPALLATLRGQLGDADELVVVDDASGDATAAVARAGGARVLGAPALPAGWTGKCWACWVGVEATEAPVLVFLDADVTLAPGTIDRLVALVGSDPDALVSVQPWHRTERPYEQLSALFNIAALMGSAAFTPLGPGAASAVAFGPVLATARTAYEAAGGHAAVRGAVAEDIALARRYPRRSLFAGRATGASFRMYPHGLRALVQGWTKNVATGAGSIRPWVFIAVVGWIWSVAGGAPTSVWLWAATAGQLGVLGRRAGRFGPVVALASPLLVWAFLAVFARSVALTVLRRDVTWRGRRVRSRP